MWGRPSSDCSRKCSRIPAATRATISCPVSNAFGYALVAALGNVVVALPSAFPVRPAAGVMVVIAIFLAKLPEGVTVSSLMMAGGRSGGQAIGAAAMLGAATLAGVALTDQISFLIHHGLALSAGVTIYVAASNLVPEFQGKRGWTLPTAFFAGAATFYVTKTLLDSFS